MAFLFAILRAALRLFTVAALFAAAENDVLCRIIPNALACLVLAVSVGLRLTSDPRGLPASVVAGSLLYVALAALYHLRYIGGGDAKLGAASSFLVPAHEVPAMLLDIAIAGGVLSLVYLAARRLSLVKTSSLPYGVAIVAGSTYRILADLLPCSNATSCW